MKMRADNPHEVEVQYDPPHATPCPVCGDEIVILYPATGAGEQSDELIAIDPVETPEGTVILIPLDGEHDRGVILSDDAAPAMTWMDKYKIHHCEVEE